MEATSPAETALAAVLASTVLKKSGGGCGRFSLRFFCLRAAAARTTATDSLSDSGKLPRSPPSALCGKETGSARPCAPHRRQTFSPCQVILWQSHAPKQVAALVALLPLFQLGLPALLFQVQLVRPLLVPQTGGKEKEDQVAGPGLQRHQSRARLPLRRTSSRR